VAWEPTLTTDESDTAPTPDLILQLRPVETESTVAGREVGIDELGGFALSERHDDERAAQVLTRKKLIARFERGKKAGRPGAAASAAKKRRVRMLFLADIEEIKQSLKRPSDEAAIRAYNQQTPRRDAWRAMTDVQQRAAIASGRKRLKEERKAQRKNKAG
jgi:hypothetical protein